MIAQRQAIRPRVEQKLGMIAAQPHAIAGVFTVYRHKVGAPFLAQTGQVLLDGLAPGAAHHVA